MNSNFTIATDREITEMIVEQEYIVTARELAKLREYLEAVNKDKSSTTDPRIKKAQIAGLESMIKELSEKLAELKPFKRKTTTK